MSQVIRVLVAEDLDWIKQRIRKAVEQQPDMVVVGEASNGAEAIELANRRNPDVLILDMEMPELNGVYVIDALANSNSPVKVLAVSAFDDLFSVRNVLKTGASGCLTREMFTDGSKAREVCCEAVRRAANGERHILSENAPKRAGWKRK